MQQIADSRIEGAVAFLKHFEETEHRMTILGAALSILDRYQMRCCLLRDADRAEDDRAPAKVAKETLAELKKAQQADLVREIKAKTIHGVYLWQLDRQAVNKKLSVRWLTDGKVPQKVEGDIVAAQDGVTLTRRREVSVLYTMCCVTHGLLWVLPGRGAWVSWRV